MSSSKPFASTLSAPAIDQAVAILLSACSVLHDFSHTYIGAEHSTDPSGYVWLLSWWPCAVSNRLNPSLTRLVRAPPGFNVTWAHCVPLPALLAPRSRAPGGRSFRGTFYALILDDTPLARNLAWKMVKPHHTICTRACLLSRLDANSSRPAKSGLPQISKDNFELILAVVKRPRLSSVRLEVLDESFEQLVFLHRGRLNAHTWDVVSLMLRDRYRCVALDQRGHGDSEWSPGSDYGMHSHLRDIEGFAGRMKLHRPVLVGQSMGGINAINYAGRRSAEMAGLVVVDVGPEINTCRRGAYPRLYRRAATGLA